MEGRRVVRMQKMRNGSQQAMRYLQRMIEDRIDSLCLFGGADRDADANEVRIGCITHH